MSTRKNPLTRRDRRACAADRRLIGAQIKAGRLAEARRMIAGYVDATLARLGVA